MLKVIRLFIIQSFFCQKAGVDKKHGGEELTLITNTEGNRKFYKKNGFQEFSDRKLEQNGQTIGNWSFCMDLHKKPVPSMA